MFVLVSLISYKCKASKNVLLHTLYGVTLIQLFYTVYKYSSTQNKVPTAEWKIT